MNIILGDNTTHPVKGFGSVKFHLNCGEFVLLHDVLYVSRLKNNLVLISALEDKGMRVAFIKGKVLYYLVGSYMRNAFTLGSRFEGLYSVIRRPFLAIVHNKNHQS